jgi:adenosine deaminase
VALVMISFLASFMSEADKQHWLAEVDRIAG